MKNTLAILAFTSISLLSSGCILSGGYVVYENGMVPDFDALEEKAYFECRKSKSGEYCANYAANERRYFEQDYQRHLDETTPPRRYEWNCHRGGRRQ